MVLKDIQIRLSPVSCFLSEQSFPLCRGVPGTVDRSIVTHQPLWPSLANKTPVSTIAYKADIVISTRNIMDGLLFFSSSAIDKASASGLIRHESYLIQGKFRIDLLNDDPRIPLHPGPMNSHL